MHISGYVLVDATQQTDQRTSQMVYLFFAEALKSTHPELQWPDGNLLKRKGDLMDYSPEILRQIREGRAKFIAMAGTYFLGVFNDNFFKQACMLLAVASGLSGLQGRATVFFALPFILCSAYAGWLADRFSKRNVVIGVKFLELTAMIIGAIGTITLNWSCIIAMVGLMGLQSTIFGPSLNGSIPELYPVEYITSANAIIKLVTTAAILLGVAFAGISLDQDWATTSVPFGRILVAVTILVVSIIGIAASFGVPRHNPAGNKAPFPWAGPLNSIKDVIETRKDSQLLIAILGDSFFYFQGSFTIMIINTLGLVQLGFTLTTTSLLSVSLMTGICAGSLVAGKTISHNNWARFMPASAFGMGICLIMAGGTPFLPGSIRLFSLFSILIFTGTCGGLFLIPLTSFIQARPAAAEKGKIIAASNFCAFSGILLSGQIFERLTHLLSPSSIILILGLSGALAAFIFFILIKRGNYYA